MHCEKIKNTFIKLLFSTTTGIIASYLIFHRPDQVYLSVFSVGNLVSKIIVALIIAAIVMLILPRNSINEKSVICIPLIAIILLFPKSIFTILLGIIFVIWFIHYFFRNVNFFQKLAVNNFFATYVVCGGFILWGIWYFIIQYLAFNSIFLIWQDWGEYSEHYLKIISQNCNLSDYLIGAGHFNPLCNLFMSLCLLIAKSPYTIFFINSLLLASLIPLSYFAAKSLKLPPAISLATSLTIAFNPIVYNQCLSLFYGFHPVNFLIPLFFCIFILYKKNHYYLSIILAIFTIFIQETVLIIWFGWFLYLILFSKHKRIGVFGLILCPLLFFIITNKLMPFLGNTHGKYAQEFHFAALGNNMLEVVLSPVLRPKVFIKTLCQWQNCAFLMIIIIPFITIFFQIFNGVIKKFFRVNIFGTPFVAETEIKLIKHLPKLITVLPFTLGVVLQSSSDIKNPLQQYGLEITILLMIFWLESIRIIYVNNKKNKNLLNFIINNLLSSIIIFSFFGINTFWSNNSIAKRPSAKPLIAHLSKIINNNHKQKKRILAPQRLRAHFCFDNSVASPNAKRNIGDYIILDLNDIVWYNQKALHRDLALDPLVQPLTHVSWYGKNFVLYMVTPKPLHKTLPFIKHCNPESLPQNALTLQTYSNGKLLIVNNELIWLVIKQSSKNYILKLKMLSATGKIEDHDIPFANGVMPLSVATPGCCFIITPPDGKLLDINFREN